MYVYIHRYTYCRGTDLLLKCLKVDNGLFVCGLPGPKFSAVVESLNRVICKTSKSFCSAYNEEGFRSLRLEFWSI